MIVCVCVCGCGKSYLGFCERVRPDACLYVYAALAIQITSCYEKKEGGEIGAFRCQQLKCLLRSLNWFS